MKSKLVVLVIVVMNVFFLREASSFSLRDREAKPKTKYQILNILSKYKKKALTGEIQKFIYNSRPSRMVGTKGNLKSRQYLLNRIKELDVGQNNLLVVDEFTPDIDFGIKFYEDDFKKQIIPTYKKNTPTFNKWKNFTNNMVKELNGLRSYRGKNIIWEKKGKVKPNDLIIISANYDTISFNKKNLEIEKKLPQPGADNNATGVAALLGLIEILSKLELNRTVRIVFFDFEELGFLGSNEFVKKYKKEILGKYNYKGLVNLVALGHDTKRSDIKKRYGNYKAYIRKPSNNGVSKDLEFGTELINMGNEFSSGIKFELLSNGMNSASHINFWKNDLKAVTFSENWEDDSNYVRHHSPNDFVETLNMKSYFNSFKFIAGMIIQWSQKD